MIRSEAAYNQLRAHPRRWLVTGVAGFIGSHLLEELLQLDQVVTGFDNFASGARQNLEEVQAQVTREQWERFTFSEGDVADLAAVREAVRGSDVILHQAGFVSVPRSLDRPELCHATNVTGMLNLLLAAREAQVRRFVYASSSAVYGDDACPVKREENIGRPLSFYAVSKLVDELYASQCAQHFGTQTVGLRYFNIYGPRQDPGGAYAAVIPQWIMRMLRQERCRVHGDGLQTRDFCFVRDVVQANLLAATTDNAASFGRAYNVAAGRTLNLRELYSLIATSLQVASLANPPAAPDYGTPRAGDIEHSSADISAIQRDLGYDPRFSPEQGLEATIRWYAEQQR
jgi:UDP-N-acetylglucosamine 4-epimerase